MAKAMWIGPKKGRTVKSRSKYSGQRVSLDFQIPPATSDVIKELNLAKLQVATTKSNTKK
ncbi:hypothetical protein DFP98_11314 [Cohnella phaseoli]|uniref:Uncharacterized protein n=1 Tax=Cohnella phaseoli TaxID=456490 RepID=A0A3D9JPK5_9BACL|nr:hypothetical protein DFP98_11314 [Cohnella phaseoli]